MYVDMHIHTCFSDGTQAPEEVAETAKNKNISVISVCDHNSIGAYDKLKPACKSLGLTLIQGVELCVTWKGRPLQFFGGDVFHLLAYNFDSKNKEILSLINKNKTEYDLFGIDMIEAISKDYPAISLRDYENYEQPLGRGGWKSINYLYDSGLCKDLLSDGLKFTKQYGNRPMKFSEIGTACGIIRSAGGVPILAHPGMYWKNDDLTDIFVELLNEGIGGLECYYPAHNESFTTKCVEFCKANNLCITCGCDSHGNFAQNIRGVFCDIGVLKINDSLLNLNGIVELDNQLLCSHFSKIEFNTIKCPY